MGEPEMSGFWDELKRLRQEKKLDHNENLLFERIAKLILTLSENPRHPGLKTHEIKPLSQKYGIKIWQSYLDQGSKAHRAFWAYGPNKGEITILGIEPHPEDGKRDAYNRIKLSSF